MPEPEIARRCRSCGASIRVVALFCPQCGVAQPQANSEQRQRSAATAAEETVPKDTAPLDNRNLESHAQPPTETLEETLKETVPKAPEKASTEPSTPPTVPAKQLQRQSQEESHKGAGAAAASVAEPAKASMGQAARGAVGAKIQRATTFARDVEGDVMHRVQKVREISSVVLDEAGYDPSLRFVLVAAFLFILFLVVVLLNKFIT
jgi:predicted RNA-binding Zn-ribbon protein involved in translation (DUF1610 family)